MNIPIYIQIILFLLVASTSNCQIELDTPLPDFLAEGKKIYQTGESSSAAKIEAEKYGVKLNAKVFSCAFCHGECGEGKMLQGLEVPNITRDQYLQRHYSTHSVLPSKREFNLRLKKIISDGINHSGEQIDEMMPKYSMSIKDMDNLLSYLEILGTDKTCKE